METKMFHNDWQGQHFSLPYFAVIGCVHPLRNDPRKEHGKWSTMDLACCRRIQRPISFHGCILMNT